MNGKDYTGVHKAIPGLVDDLAKGTLSRREFLRTSTLLGLSAAVAYSIAGEITGQGFVAPASAQDAPARGGRLRIGMNVLDISDPAVFDWSEKGNVARQIVEPLVRIGSDDVAHPWLAESWEANDDLTVWTFHLRPNVKWNNGDTFNADDVIATFTRWLDPATGSSNQGRFSSMTVTEGESTVMAPNAIEKVDDLTLRFNLQRPTLALPESMGDYPALITHRNFVADGANLVRNPIGTGPFTLVNFAVGEQALLARRPDGEYWAGDPLVDEVQFINLGADPSAQVAALASDQVDLLYTLDINLIPTLQGMPGMTLYDKVTAITGVPRMRVVEPPYDNKALRQAIQVSIDHQRLLDLAYQGLGVAGEDHHVSPIHPEYTPLPPPAQNYEKAKALLAEAGYPNGVDLEIVAVNDPKWESDIAQVIAEMVKPAGINLAVNVLPGGTYWDRWTQWPFSVTQWTSRPLGVQVLSLAYRTGVDWNETGYSNPEFDRVLDQAEGTIDVEARKALVLELEKILQDDAIIILPFWAKIYTASTSRVHDFEYHIAREMWLQKVWLG